MEPTVQKAMELENLSDFYETLNFLEEKLGKITNQTIKLKGLLASF